MFCTSQQVAEEDARHDLDSCPSGGMLERQGRLGQHLFTGDYPPETGCPYCALPRDMCVIWSWNEERRAWTQNRRARCQFGGVVVDTVTVLFQTGEPQYFEGIYEQMIDDREEELTDDGDEEEGDLWSAGDVGLAEWLAKPVFGEPWSNIMATFITWTQHIMG